MNRTMFRNFKRYLFLVSQSIFAYSQIAEKKFDEVNCLIV